MANVNECVSLPFSLLLTEYIQEIGKKKQDLPVPSGHLWGLASWVAF